MYTNKQTRYLRSLAHALKPVVRIGQRGITPGVADELEHALLAHELLKIKIETGDRTTRKALLQQLCESSGAHLVQSIGNIAVMYRRNDAKPKIQLP
ncbi:MAG: ribosome assembly RNA-binding protein YhbY [Gammaproteobacteria bacterium]|nr:ribosome assembly RNA-binding protein YhbY [Gammaproteobacteria bacterium]